MHSVLMLNLYMKITQGNMKSGIYRQGCLYVHVPLVQASVRNHIQGKQKIVVFIDRWSL